MGEIGVKRREGVQRDQQAEAFLERDTTTGAINQQLQVARHPARPHDVTGIDGIGEELAVEHVGNEILAVDPFERDLDPCALHIRWRTPRG